MSPRTVYRLQSTLASLLVDVTTVGLGEAYGGGERMATAVRACQKEIQLLLHTIL